MTFKKAEFGNATKDTLPLFVDLYELTMAQCHLESDHNVVGTFDLSFRELPANRGYIVAAGLEQIIAYIESIHFNENSIEFLEEIGFGENLCTYLSNFKFTGDIRAVPEGTIVFQNEPIIEITAPIVEAQILETIMINQVGFQSLVATKAARIYDVINRNGNGQSLIEFGARRAHGVDAGMKAARASYVGGFDGTSNVSAGYVYGIPVIGTMAHSWIQSHETEEDAFESFVEVYGKESILLIDTYDTIESAKKVKKIVRGGEVVIKGVRLDSGDLVSLSKEVKSIIEDIDIYVTSGLDEYAVEHFLKNGGIASGFGIGGNLVTSCDTPVAEIVYKLVEIEQEGNNKPSMKLSEGKMTYPGKKCIKRIIEDGQFKYDILALEMEEMEGEDQMVEVYRDGELEYDLPDLKTIRDRMINSMNSLNESHREIKNPARYEVEISKKLLKLVEEFDDQMRASGDK
jgi:nicotinate phosphoribosyltransferase